MVSLTCPCTQTWQIGRSTYL